jgi:hypothetical protein
MKSTGILIACGVLLLTGSIGAQSTPAADPITGTWTGHMARNDGPQRQYITLKLKLDGNRITGTVTGPPSPGEIRTGTFDRATGALRLEIVVQDDSKSVAVFEGRLAEASAKGRVSLNNVEGTFDIRKDTAGSAASPAAAQGPSVEATMAALSRGFAEVSGYITKSADLVPADKYGYKPTASVRTYGQMIGHIVDGYTFYCARATGRKVEWSDATEKGGGDKAALVQKLKQATDACRTAYGTGGDVGELLGNIGHSNLHYGNLVTYIRMLGLVPPSS